MKMAPWSWDVIRWYSVYLSVWESNIGFNLQYQNKTTQQQNKARQNLRWNQHQDQECYVTKLQAIITRDQSLFSNTVEY